MVVHVLSVEFFLFNFVQ